MTVDVDRADQLAAAWYGTLARSCKVAPGGWSAQRDDAWAFVTNTGLPTMNIALSTVPGPGPASEESLAALDGAALEVAGSGLPWSIIVRGGATPAAVALAARHGLTERDEMPLMACSADDAVLRAEEALAPSIRPVSSAASEVYTEVLAEGFGVPASVFGSLMGSLLGMPEITGYLAELDGRPVATALRMQDDRAVGVGNIGVVPEYRGRGLGRAITARVMADGFAAGADVAYLHTTPTARSLYGTMGFDLLETWTAFVAP